jgi:hypothetical protein
MIGHCRGLAKVAFEQWGPLAEHSVAGIYIARVATMEDAVRSSSLPARGKAQA